MPHISVMIPVYNRAHLVGRTIESVLQQSFHDLDIVVVDDASTDDTVEVVSAYADRDPRLTLVVNEKNLGLTGNWNRCLELATGPLVQIMQSDDLVDPDYLERVSEVFDTYPTVGFVAASCRYTDINDQVIHPGTPRPARLYRAGDEAVTALLTGGHPHYSSIVMRRRCYEEQGGFDREIWFGPDVEMNTRLAACYDFYHFGQVHTSFRRHGSNRGAIEFARQDYLTTYMHSLSLSWGYLSPEGRRRLGVDDLETYIAHNTAVIALTGAIAMVAYGRTGLSRYYLREARRLHPMAWQRPRFWKALALLMMGGLGTRIMQRRMKTIEEDRANLPSYERTLHA